MFLGSLATLSNDSVGNYIVQTILSTARNKIQAESYLKELLPVFGTLVDSKLGVVWHLTEMLSKFRIGQETLHKKLQENLQRGSKLSISECVPKLIRFVPAKDDKGRINVNANGCKVVLNMLRFVPRLCNPVLNSIFDHYDADELCAMARDPLGSRWYALFFNYFITFETLTFAVKHTRWHS